MIARRTSSAGRIARRDDPSGYPPLQVRSLDDAPSVTGRAVDRFETLQLRIRQSSIGLVSATGKTRDLIDVREGSLLVIVRCAVPFHRRVLIVDTVAVVFGRSQARVIPLTDLRAIAWCEPGLTVRVWRQRNSTVPAVTDWRTLRHKTAPFRLSAGV